MQHQEGRIKGANGVDVYTQSWLPNGPCRSLLLIVHGLAEHSGRYMNLVNRFVPMGYAVYGIDHIGHGRSKGTRVYVDRFEDYTETLKTYVDLIREETSGKPIFLVGHSMGGLISAAYLIDHPADFTGVVLSGPSVKMPDNISAFVIFTGKVLSVLMPRAGLVALDAKGVSRDPAVVQDYVDDPLVHTGKATARLGAELLKAMRRVTAGAARITLPILILHGGADRLVDPSSSQMLYENVGSADKTIRIYEGLYHEVFNEPEHDRVLGEVEEWLEAHAVS